MQNISIILPHVARKSACWLTGAALFCSSLHAANVTSTWNAGSGNWGLSSNWTNVPAQGGFPNNGNGGVATYDAVLANGGTITLDQNITIQKFDLSNGTVTGAFNLTLNDNLAWTGGYMIGTGTTSVAGAGSTISGTGTKSLERTLTNTGTITDSVTDQTTPLYFGLNSGVTAAILNNAGTFNVTAGGDFSQNNPNANDAINNSGTWNVSGAGFTSIVNSGLAFNNTGTVNVQSGTLELDGGGTDTGNFAISTGAVLNFGGGTHNLNAGSVVSGAGTFQAGGGTVNLNAGTYNVTTTAVSGGAANFNIAASTTTLNLSGGTLGGTATLSATGNLAWTGGYMIGTGITSVAGAGSTISGTGTKSLERTLTNTGTITDSVTDQTTPFYFGLNSGVTAGILNNAGTFNVTAGGDFSQNNPNANDAINNSGTWNVSGAGFTSIVSGIAFNNTGTVNVQSGTLDLTAATVPQYASTTLTGGIWSVLTNSERHGDRQPAERWSGIERTGANRAYCAARERDGGRFSSGLHGGAIRRGFHQSPCWRYGNAGVIHHQFRC